MTSGPDGIWPPRTEEQLAQAAQDGVLIESGRLELKHELPPPGASVIGISRRTSRPSRSKAESSSSESMRTPRLRRSIPSISLGSRRGWSRSRPPRWTRVCCHHHPDRRGRPTGPRLPDRSGTAVTQAPHMVDGKYYGRGDKTNRVLSHAEVFRIQNTKSRSNEAFSARPARPWTMRAFSTRMHRRRWSSFSRNRLVRARICSAD